MILRIVPFIASMFLFYKIGYYCGYHDLLRKGIDRLFKWRKENYPTWEEKQEDVHDK